MSALTIRPVAAGQRHLFCVHGIRALRLIPAVVLLLNAAILVASEEPSKPFLERNSFYLSSAGFRIQAELRHCLVFKTI